MLEDYEFLRVGEFDVLLPVDKRQHYNLTFVKSIVSDDRQTLTLFLRDTTYETGIFAGRIAVCSKFGTENFLTAVLYHECFIIEAGQTQRTD